MIYKSNIDIPIAIIFFNRPEALENVFASVKKARPSNLFLIQDGARENHPNDEENIERCREIVESIDWECEVRKNYSEVNLGCGGRIYSGISWCFEYVDRLVILEDDCVPSDSFYMFCKEVLERYLHDPRVGMISGMNHLDEFNLIDYDYLFSTVGSIAGWATWKRSWSTIDYEMKFLDNENVIRLIKNCASQKCRPKKLLKNGLERRAILRNDGKLTSWSYQRGINDYLHSALVIVPKKNLMTNIGLTSESVHSPNDIKKVPRGLRRIYQLKLYDFDFPLKHPEFIIEDYEYNDMVRKIMDGNSFVKLYRKFESAFYQIIYGDIKKVFKKIKKKLVKK